MNSCYYSVRVVRVHRIIAKVAGERERNYRFRSATERPKSLKEIESGLVDKLVAELKQP